jgi:hypothetical protein
MPASRSRNREPSPPAPKRLIWPIALVAVLAIGVVVLIALPASLITRFLPAQIHAEDFSGSIWHGSSGRISFESRPVGALEWHLHPFSLLSMAVAADLRWVKGSTVIDGSVSFDSHGFTARDIRGGGPLEDLRDLGMSPGWSGNTQLDLAQITGTFSNIESAAGTIDFSAVASAGIAGGAELGSYRLTLSPKAVDADSVTATVQDMGGPLEAQVDIRYTPASRTGLLSGTIKERADAAPALRTELANLAQMRPRDRLGRIPVEFEFAL